MDRVCLPRWAKLDRPTSNIGKIALKNFLRKNDLPYLKLLRAFPEASDIDLRGMPDHFAFKPASLWSGTGVRLLHRISGIPSWFDAKKNLVMPEAEIIR